MSETLFSRFSNITCVSINDSGLRIIVDPSDEIYETPAPTRFGSRSTARQIESVALAALATLDIVPEVSSFSAIGAKSPPHVYMDNARHRPQKVTSTHQVPRMPTKAAPPTNPSPK